MAKLSSRSSRRPRRAVRGVRSPSLRRRSTSEVRVARPTDLPDLVLHRRRMWQELGRYATNELDRADVEYGRWFRREAAAHRVVAFVIDGPGGRPVASGVVWLSPNQPRPGRLAGPAMPYVLSMYTAPAERRRGAATAIVRRMIAWSRSRGYRRIYLHASEGGRPVYARLGFTNGNEMRLELGAARRT